MWVVGDSEYGQFANNVGGTTGRRSSPVQITGTWLSVYAHDNAVFGIKEDNTLWAWGRGHEGALAQNNEVDYSSPVQIPGTTWVNVDGDQAGVKTDGTLWTWGNNEFGQLGQNQGPSQLDNISSPVQVGSDTTWSSGDGKLDSGHKNTFAIKTDGTLWSWGGAGWGQLGLNFSSPGYISSPTQVPGTTWDKINTESSTVLATKTDGTLWTWGYNAGYGAMGVNDRTNRSSPTQVPGTTWSIPRNAGYTSGAIKTDGTLWVWGRNDEGQLGLNSTIHYSSPVQIPGTTWSSLDLVAEWAMALKTDGTWWGWGNNSYGKLGQNDQVKYSSPVQIPGTTWEKLAIGNHYAIALKPE